MADFYNYQNRKSVPDKYKVDLSSYFKNDKEWYQKYEEVKEILPSLEKYQGKLLEDTHILEKFLGANDSVNSKLDNLYVYASVKHNCDMQDSKSFKMYNLILSLYASYSTITSFVTPELLQKDYNYVQKLIKNNKNLEKYRFYLDNIYRYKNYTLSEKEEKLISSFSDVFSSYETISNILNNMEIKFGTVKVDGIDKEITSANSLEFLTHKDRQVRKKFIQQKCKKLKEFNETFATNFVVNLKSLDINAKLRGFKSYQEESLYEDKMTISIYDKLIGFIKNNSDVMQEYYRLLKKYLKVDRLYTYDLNAPLTKNSNNKYKVEDAKKMIESSLSVLGVDYQNIINKAFTEKWIDYCTSKGKVQQCYSISGYKTNPVVFINYLGNIADISTLAHELGHAVHFYLSSQNNNYIDYDFTLLVAEIASLTNEILFAKYIIANSDKKEEKLVIIHNLLDTILGNFFDAAKEAEFEEIVNNKINQGESLNGLDINEIWSQVNKEYYKDYVERIEDEDINWVKVPHFLEPFYTYKYSVGISGACYVATNILNKTPGFLEKYLTFLKSGGSDYPLNQLEKLGIDLTSNEMLQNTVDIIKDLIKEFESLYEEVNNNE